MITEDDFYKVMCAMVPLYFAMLVAYGSVKWWKIFSPEQCAGINRFVAVFAVPVLSFHFISQNNPYEMDTKFILADTLSKALVLLLLSVWAVFCKGGSLEWLITIFSVSTLPNTLVMGIPLLKAMYGDFTQSLMVQIVVLQCIIWYMLFYNNNFFLSLCFFKYSSLFFGLGSLKKVSKKETFSYIALSLQYNKPPQVKSKNLSEYSESGGTIARKRKLIKLILVDYVNN